MFICNISFITVFPNLLYVTLFCFAGQDFFGNSIVSLYESPLFRYNSAVEAADDRCHMRDPLLISPARIQGRKRYTMSNPIVTIEMENGDIMKAELYPEIAPNTVNNFISLIQKGYYDGLIFHRVINGFMIQGGCPDGTGMGGPGYDIKGEFSQNGFKNDLKHSEGVLSMARTMIPDSAGSQFFIMHKNSPHLDGAYAAFGKVIDGMDVVNKIAETATDYSDRPLQPQVMKTVTVETFGVDYPEPEKC